MRAFSCDHCQASIAFENTLCANCGSPVAYDRRQRRMVVESHDPLELSGLRYQHTDGHVGVPCAHLDLANCNWLAEPDALDGLCASCQLTRTRPANDDPSGLLAFVAAETAKRRLLFQLDELGLPSFPRFAGAGGIAFDLISSERGCVSAGYADGVITIDLAAGPDDPEMALAPPPLDSPGPTLLSRLRHQIGHWYFDLLIDGTDWFDRLLQLTPGEPAAEAFATACAQYLELRDALETAASFDVRIVDGDEFGGDEFGGDELGGDDVGLNDSDGAAVGFDELVARWRPLTAAVNALSRSRGEPDPYPIAYSDSTLARLRLVHDRLNVR